MTPIHDYHLPVTICGNHVVLGPLDFVGIFIMLVLAVIYFNNFVHDARGYAKIDPLKIWEGKSKS